MTVKDVTLDHFAIIRVDGMHCHKCERALQRALGALPGVHEVEVDFLSGQASVLYDKSMVTVDALTSTVTAAGYRVGGLTQRSAE